MDEQMTYWPEQVRKAGFSLPTGSTCELLKVTVRAKELYLHKVNYMEHTMHVNKKQLHIADSDTRN